MKRQLLSIAIAALVLALSGCPLKKQRPPVPQQGQAPTVPAPTPAPQPPAQQPAEAQPAPAPAETQQEKTETAEKPQPKKKPSAKKPAVSPASTQGQQPSQASAPTPATPPAKTSKLIIQEGSSTGSKWQLAAGVGLDDRSAHKQTTEQLLQSTQANLNTINRPLSPEEQSMVAQIMDYMAQSRKATADSDTVRAHNLALKAHLLSDELVKH